MGYFHISIQKELETREYKLLYGLYINSIWLLVVFKEDGTTLKEISCPTLEECWTEVAEFLTSIGDVIQIKGDPCETLYTQYLEDRIHTIKNKTS